MTMRPRPNTFSAYRVFFTLAFSLGGVFALGLAGWAYWGTLGIFAVFGVDAGAAIKGTAIGGVLCLAYAAVMMRIMTDRRVVANDRRQRQVPISFPDRRCGKDRRGLIDSEDAAEVMCQLQ